MSHESFNRREKIKPGSDRNFGLTFAVVFLIMGAYESWLWTLSLIFTLVSFFRPQILRRPKMYWLKFGLLLNRLVSPVILGILFYAIFFPVGFLLRLVGKDILNIKLNPVATSYWIKSESPQSTMRDQF